MRKTLVVMLVAVMTPACSDFLIPSIHQFGLSVLAPLDSARLHSDQVLFWWDSVQGANAYQVQIVKPSFKRIEELISDTLVKSNKMTVNLEPGQYQWRIRAVDDDDHSEFMTFTLFMDSAAAGGRLNEGYGMLRPGSESPAL
nr:hypothetical protein [uncultured Dyadobacter sp.]